MDFIFSLGVNDRNSYSGDKTKRDETYFLVVKSIVFKGEGRAFKYSRGIGEVEPMILQFRLRLVSFQVNCTQLLYMRCVYAASAPGRQRST